MRAYTNKFLSAIFVALLALIIFHPANAAVQWRRVGTVAGTLTNGQLCYTNGTDLVCDTNSPTLYNGLIGIGTSLPAVSLDLSKESDAIAFPVGTTGQRPSGANGMVRYNSTTPGLEAYVNGVWASLLSSAGLGSGVTLGTSTAATNPQVSGDPTTGLYTAGPYLVDVSASGTQVEEWSTNGVNITTGGLNIAGVNGVSFAKDYKAGASISIGSSALVSQPLGTTAVQGNVAIGYQAISSAGLTAAGIRNTAVGYQADLGNTTGNNNTAVGFQAMNVITTGIDNVAVGAQALAGSGGSYSTVVGNNAASNLTSGSNTAIGSSALSGSGGTRSGSHNTGVGISSLSTIDTASYNTAVGEGAGSTIVYGANNVMLGYYAMSNSGATYSNSNVAIGYLAAQYLTGGSNNIFIGAAAGAGSYSAQTGSQNTTLGSSTGRKLAGGGSNLLLGYNVGSSTLTTGNGNILLGTSGAIDTPASNTSNFLNIANLIYGTNIGTQGQGAVGIGTAVPATTLDVRNAGGSDAFHLGNTAGDAYLFGYSTGSSSVTLGAYSTSGGTIPLQLKSTAVQIYNSNYTGVSIGTTTAAPTNGMIVTGSVGIGTTAPAVKLEVAGTAKIGNGGESCTSANYGSVHYNALGYFEICSP